MDAFALVSCLNFLTGSFCYSHLVRGPQESASQQCNQGILGMMREHYRSCCFRYQPCASAKLLPLTFECPGGYCGRTLCLEHEASAAISAQTRRKAPAYAETTKGDSEMMNVNPLNSLILEASTPLWRHTRHLKCMIGMCFCCL